MVVLIINNRLFCAHLIYLRLNSSLLIVFDETEINASVDKQCVLNVFPILWPSMNELKLVNRVNMFNEKHV